MTESRIPSGTLVDKRYQIKYFLGQGGFGRTYLASDKRRYDEPCVIKEFVAIGTNQNALEKSRQLFQQEAKVLYKLDNLQIPKFLAEVEEDGRLFFVQEYIDGKNYRTLLEERLQEQKCFSEAEVIEWLRDMLLVLKYIHGQNIFHRDISPDNIILPNKSKLPPVLIDFGVVGSLGGTTSVGKVGYAPPEQMLRGECSANSDLYALAVTAIELLTGKTPDSLFNKHSLQMQWRSHASITEELAQILNKMLENQPENRYQSATEVLTAMQSLGTTQLQYPLKAVSRPLSYGLGILIAFCFLGVGVGLLSPYITTVCGVLNNCLTDREYEATYNAAVQEGTVANTFATNVKSISQLTNSRDRLKIAITKLSTIPQTAKINSQVQTVLSQYQSELTLIEQRLNQETKVQQQLSDAEKTTSDAIEKSQNTDDISDLTIAKQSLQDAKNKIKLIPSNAIIIEEVKSKIEYYDHQINIIDTKIKQIKSLLPRTYSTNSDKKLNSGTPRIKNKTNDQRRTSKNRRVNPKSGEAQRPTITNEPSKPSTLPSCSNALFGDCSP